MAGRFERLARGAKDAALAATMRTLINRRLRGIGEITDLSIDTAGRRARLRLALRGEREAIEVVIPAYDVEHEDGQDWLIVVDAAASREWVTALLQQWAVGRRLEIPAAAARALRLLT